MDNVSTDIFKRACLLELSCSVWANSKAIEPYYMQQVGDMDWVKGKKLLVSADSLSPIKSIVARTRSYLKKYVLPFPIQGLILVSKENISRIDQRLETVRREFWEKVNGFGEKYDEKIAQARQNLGDLFSEADYPIDVFSKFKFEWRFLTLEVPKKATVLSPEVYQREKAKFEQMMEETRELAMLALREEFQEIVAHMIERLTGEKDGKPKIFKNSMLRNLNEFLDGFQNRDLFDDSELRGIVSQAKAIINGTSPEDLRNNEWLRERVRDRMELVKDAIDESLQDLPRRKIRMAA